MVGGFRSFLLLPIISCIIINEANCANILLAFGGGNASHKMSVWPFVLGLANKGHNITFVSSTDKKFKAHPNITDLTPEIYKKMTEALYKVNRFQERKDKVHHRLWYDYGTNVLQICDKLFNSDDSTINQLLEQKFDLVIVNSVYGECGILLTHYFGAKMVVFGSSTVMPWFHGIYGTPYEYWAPPIAPEFDKYPLSLWGRVKTYYQHYAMAHRDAFFQEGLIDLYKKRFGYKNVPTLYEMERNASLILVNSHFTIDFTRSLPPVIVQIGGMQCWEPEKELPQKFQKWMDGAEDGVVLISFGTTVDFNSLSEYYRNVFFNNVKKFNKLRFIIRWTGQLPSNVPDNLITESWLPQRELMRHPKMLVFITHCGLNSVTEATYHAIPIICLPLFADQDYSAYRLEAHEVGVRLEVADLSESVLENAIIEITQNPKYKQNMLIRSELFKDRPNPADTAVEAIEYVLRHDNLAILHLKELDDSWFIRSNIDVHFTILMIVLIFPLLIVYFILKIAKYILK